MMVTRYTEKAPGAPPTKEELVKLWNLMVKAQGRGEYEFLAPAKRLVGGRQETVA
jgi:hypothetical protein